MRLSSRLPRHAEPNAWARLLDQRRRSGARLLDLTEANPTRLGLSGAGPRELAALAGPGAASYDPDPRGAPAAREAVAAYYAWRGVELSAGDVVLTSGTSESYAHLFRLLCDPGDELLVPQPSYPLFEPLAALEGVRLRSYRLVHRDRWWLDAESVAAALGPATRGMVLVEPNHPTGSCLSLDERAFVEGLCAERGICLISDEVFGDFPWPGRRATGADRAGTRAAGAERAGAPATGTEHAVSPAIAADRAAARDPRSVPALPSMLASRAAPTFVLSGLSKVCGMPQLKLGWIALAGPDRARAAALSGLEWIADLFLSVSTPVQLALPRLLEARHAFQAKVRERIAANLARVRESVARRPELSLLGGDGGWAATLRVPPVRSEEDWALELLRRDVVAHPGHFYDLTEEPHLVLSLIVDAGVFADGMERLEALLDRG